MASRNVCCTFTVAVWSVYLHKGTLWSKRSLNDCSVLYLSDIKLDWKHFEATTYSHSVRLSLPEC
jgi:hypothetical protein